MNDVVRVLGKGVLWLLGGLAFVVCGVLLVVSLWIVYLGVGFLIG